MADSSPTGSNPPAPLPVPREAVERSAGASYWSVSGGDWGEPGTALPAEYAELVAPPIVVRAAAARDRVESPERVARASIDDPGTTAARAPVTLEMLIYRPDGTPAPRPESRVSVPAPPRAPGRHRASGV